LFQDEERTVPALLRAGLMFDIVNGFFKSMPINGDRLVGLVPVCRSFDLLRFYLHANGQAGSSG
jgi:hypothetical protein